MRMALASMMPTSPFNSAFSPYTDSPAADSPLYPSFVSPGGSYTQMHRLSASSVNDKDGLIPPPSPYPATVDPSPVESSYSNTTDTTEIEEDDEERAAEADELRSPDVEIISPTNSSEQNGSMTRFGTDPLVRRSATLPTVNTKLDDHLRTKPSEDAPASVIHAPSGFRNFVVETSQGQSASSSRPGSPSASVANSTAQSMSASTDTVQPTTIHSPSSQAGDVEKNPLKGTTPINTQVPPATGRITGATPRASTKQEADEEWMRRRQSLASGASANSYGSDEGRIASMGEALRNLNTAEMEIDSLKTALSEIWTLCNTLAQLSSVHRERMFSISGSGDIQEQAWKSCWRLCQMLYESRNEDHSSQVKPTLELCRDFCQALFEARQRGDEVTDSILRVSFELNNHLYNTHDRNLPDVFRERTLDFYLTMCHRLMKQRTSLPEEADSLLRACWSLAEILFTLRQNNRDSKPLDEEMLTSAVQACWELGDLFREGWAQVRPDRGTPKPHQRQFFPNSSSLSVHERTLSRPNSVLSLDDSLSTASISVRDRPPETPTTIFDDREELSPYEAPVPNILVLGPDTYGMMSSGSVFSDRSSASSTPAPGAPHRMRGNMSSTSSTHSSQVDGEDPHLIRLKGLIIKASYNLGYSRQSTTPLPTFVRNLTPTAFGTQPWQVQLFESFRKLVMTDPTLRDRASLPAGLKFSSTEISRAVQWVARSDQFVWLRDLYRLVFGFSPEEAKKTIAIQV